MWLIHDYLFLDREKAKELEDGKDVARKVFVGVDEDIDYDLNGDSTEVFGSWIFTNEKECRSEVDEFNEY